MSGKMTEATVLFEVSTFADTQGWLPVAFILPAAWTAEPTLTFQAAGEIIGPTGKREPEATFRDVKVASTGLELTVLGAEADAHLAVDNPAVFAGCRFLKIRSGVSGGATAQGADRLVRIVLRQDV
jgi:hypothetical protein